MINYKYQFYDNSIRFLNSNRNFVYYSLSNILPLRYSFINDYIISAKCFGILSFFSKFWNSSYTYFKVDLNNRDFYLAFSKVTISKFLLSNLFNDLSLLTLFTGDIYWLVIHFFDWLLSLIKLFFNGDFLLNFFNKFI